MKVNNPVKEIAKKLVWINDICQDPKTYEWEKEELREEANKLTMEVVMNPQLSRYIDMIPIYMEEYKTLTVAEYYEWIKQ